MSDPGKLGPTTWVVVGPQGVYHVGLYEDEESVWFTALGWPDPEEIEDRKRAGWYATQATITWTKPGVALRYSYEVRVAGPDDVIPFASELEAHRHANSINATYLRDRLAHPDDEVLCVATVHTVAPTEPKT